MTRGMASTTAALRVRWRGDFSGAHSLARVNREIAGRLGATSEGAVAWTRDAGASADVVVSHGWPPLFAPPEVGVPWIVFQPWEFGSMPRSWLAPFRDAAAEVWTYSAWNRDRYVEDGLDPARVAVIPLGVDATTFRPDAPPLARVAEATDRAFKFLFVGGTIRRKGVDVLLEAWRRAFGRDDDAALIIKDFCRDGAYRGQTHEAEIRRVAEDPACAPLVYLDDDLPAADLPGLYTACDVLVHPYRGEGFGLPALEALACGRPTIVTKGGACDDFSGPDGSLFVAAERRPVRPAEPLVRDGFLLEPSVDQLVMMLRLARAHAARLREMGARARERVARDWTWERSARAAARRLEAVARR
jgi:glycosyltransferase involved in cell wall biosynthesis